MYLYLIIVIVFTKYSANSSAYHSGSSERDFNYLPISNFPGDEFQAAPFYEDVYGDQMDIEYCDDPFGFDEMDIETSAPTASSRDTFVEPARVNPLKFSTGDPRYFNKPEEAPK